MKKFTGIWVPAEVWQMEALSYGHCLMLGHLLTLSKQSGRCNPSNATLGQLFRLKERQVRQLLHDLAGWNLLDIQGEGKARELVPTRQFSAGLEAEQPGDFSPGSEEEQPGSFSPEPGSFSPGSENQPGDFSPTNPAVFRQQPGDFSPGIYKDENKIETKKEIKEDVEEREREKIAEAQTPENSEKTPHPPPPAPQPESGWPGGSRYDEYFRTLAANMPLAEGIGMKFHIAPPDLPATLRTAIRIFLLDQESTSNRYDTDRDLIKHFRNWFTDYHRIYLQPQNSRETPQQPPAPAPVNRHPARSAPGGSTLRPNGAEPRNGRRFGKL